MYVCVVCVCVVSQTWSMFVYIYLYIYIVTTMRVRGVDFCNMFTDFSISYYWQSVYKQIELLIKWESCARISERAEAHFWGQTYIVNMVRASDVRMVFDRVTIYITAQQKSLNEMDTQYYTEDRFATWKKKQQFIKIEDSSIMLFILCAKYNFQVNFNWMGAGTYYSIHILYISLGSTSK